MKHSTTTLSSQVEEGFDLHDFHGKLLEHREALETLTTMMRDHAEHNSDAQNALCGIVAILRPHLTQFDALCDELEKAMWNPNEKAVRDE